MKLSIDIVISLRSPRTLHRNGSISMAIRNVYWNGIFSLRANEIWCWWADPILSIIPLNSRRNFKNYLLCFGLLNTPCKCTSECNSVCPKQQSKHCKYWYGLPLLLTIRFASIKQFMKTNIGCCWFFSYYFFGVIAYLYICVLKLYLISFCLTDFNG